MEIILNGEPRQVDDATSVAALVETLGMEQRRIAVEVNREIVPRGEHDRYRLQPGDRVEIVHAIGGG